MVGQEIPTSLLIERAQFAASALAGRGIDLGDAFDRWTASIEGVRVVQGPDGNLTRHRSAGRIELQGDHRAVARQLFDAHGPALAASRAPITIEGLDPPWLALGMLEITAGPGYTPTIRLIQADPLELLEGCSLADVTPLLESGRVEWFVGPDAAEQVAASIDRLPGLAHEGPVVQLQTLRTPVGPGLGRALQAAMARQAEAHRRNAAVIRERDADSTPRIARVASNDRPPRVALIAGRFTTVLRPMAEDLAAAFEARGCETRFITEPSDHRTLTPAAYTAAFADFDPDLVVCANHTRDDMDRLLGEHIMPRAVPWVTWIQDAMPHLLRPEAGAAIGPADLAVGHITDAMLDRFGYPADRSLRTPMVASERKFNPDRVDPDLARALACDAAAFTNHSETPERMRARLIDEVSGSTHAASIVDHIAGRVLELATRPPSTVRARAACADIVDGLAPGADAATRENLLENVALRLYDRACRHAALAWASQICRGRNWRFSIFGSGWADHPTLADHARGTLSHGDELCTAYAAASLTLETTTLGLLHQRVLECTLAGGLPAVLVTGEACTIARARLRHRLTTDLRGHAVPVAHEPGKIAFPAYRVAEADRFNHLNLLLGFRHYPYAIVHDRPAPAPTMTIDSDSAVGLVERGYHDGRSLERLLERAQDSEWRDAERERVIGVIREHCTHDALAESIIGHYRKQEDTARPGQTSAA